MALLFPFTANAVLNPDNCFSVIQALTPIQNTSELTINSDIPVAGAVAISKWYGKTPHFSYIVGTYDTGEPMVFECGKGLGDNPEKGKGDCGFRILGSSPNEEIIGYHVF